VSPAAEEIDIPPEDFPTPIEVRGRTVVVTGATRGLGRVLVTAFARSGATVGLVARNQEQLLTTVASLPGEHIAFAGDVRDEQFNQTVADAMRAKFGHLDVWIANAGVSPALQRAESLPGET
jgi:NAD(P)-dependent dehydrogenase (short-subunit alcohol dehydrogenase family)